MITTGLSHWDCEWVQPRSNESEYHSLVCLEDGREVASVIWAPGFDVWVAEMGPSCWEHDSLEAAKKFCEENT